MIETEGVNLYPEAIERQDIEIGPWTIEDRFGSIVDLNKRVMRAPLGTYVCSCGHDHPEGLRLHEMAHVAFTPADYALQIAQMKLPHDLALAVEDARVGVRLEGAGLACAPLGCPDHIGGMLSYLLAAKDAEGLVKTMVAAYATPATRQSVRDWVSSVADSTNPYIGYITKTLNYFTTEDAPRFTRTIYYTRCLMEVQEDLTNHFRQQSIVAAETIDALCEMLGETPDEVAEIGSDGWRPRYASHRFTWGEMIMDPVPLTKPARVEPTRKWTYRDEGVLPTAIHRYSVDGRIFQQSAHRGEGTVLLVDCSGSMRWSKKDLHAVLDVAPATTVALYSGNDYNGKLRIVAQGGRRAEDRDIGNPARGNNCIDGPVLRWLAKQKGRRLWLSDGIVTGVGDSTSRVLLLDAANIVCKNKIMRVDQAPDAIAVVQGRASFKPTTKPVEAIPWLARQS